ncbi:MAG: N-acetyl-gamma-glutamyl-phosphate reductase, partial [Sphingobacteriales bacterium]
MNSKKIKAGIIGGAGYTGGEMLRILINHPNVEITFVNSTS